MQSLKNKVAVITGGNSGIGLAIAKRYAEQGAKVVIAARRENKLQEAKQLMTGEVSTCVCDVACLTDIDNLRRFTQTQYGHVDILVTCAGVADYTHVKNMTEERFDQVAQINYKGTYFTVQRFLPILNPGSSIILISSTAAHMGSYTHSLYASTKAAVLQLAKSFAADLLEDNIRVNAIVPGPTDTPIFDNKPSGHAHLREEALAMVPQKRLGTPDEIADLALYLATPASRFITGQGIVIDGGASTLSGCPS